jgi:hypothetical protein
MAPVTTSVTIRCAWEQRRSTATELPSGPLPGARTGRRRALRLSDSMAAVPRVSAHIVEARDVAAASDCRVSIEVRLSVHEMRWSAGLFGSYW